MQFRIDHNLVDVPLVPATDHLPTYNTMKGNEITCATWKGFHLKLNFIEYPAIHTNYSLSNCTIWN